MAEGERVDSGAMCGGGWQRVAAGSIESVRIVCKECQWGAEGGAAGLNA